MFEGNRTDGFWSSPYVVAILFVAACNQAPDSMGASRAAIHGGEIAYAPEFDAVMCIPRYRHTEGCDSHGWNDCLLRCVGTGTLISPNVVLGERARLVSQSHPITLGYNTRDGGYPADDVSRQTALEIGSTVNAVDDGPAVLNHAVWCLELRKSGLAPCCRHVFTTDASLGEVAPGHALYSRYYAPLPERWDDPFPACSTASEGCIYGEPGSGYHTYQDYVDTCAAPMAPDDGVISDIVLLVLSERIDEREVAPIPLALSYPDGSTNPSWFDITDAEGLPISGDTVGYAEGTPGITSLGFQQGIRRVARASVALTTTIPPLVASLEELAPELTVRFTAVGERLPNTRVFRSDASVEDAGPFHIDFGAPWILGTGTDRRVFAISRGDSTDRLNTDFDAPISDVSIAGLRRFLDPDGDGLYRGQRDAVGGDTAYIDADSDGLSEYRAIPRLRDTSCLSEVTRPALPGTCWVTTGNDNCAPPPDGRWAGYFNPDQRDRDGDLVGDACDLCPTIWNAAQEACVAPQDATWPVDGRRVRRGDRVGLACARLIDPVTGAKVAPNRLIDGAAPRADQDGDGALDGFCDNCLGLFNPGQEDSDGDGVGDVCDICNDFPNPAQDCTDEDGPIDSSTGQRTGDGIPDECDNCPPSACRTPEECANHDQADFDMDSRGDVCDNCRAQANPAQENCNEEAENERNRRLMSAGEPARPLRGDACDPVPCAETQISERQSAAGPLGERTLTMDRIEYDGRIGTDDPSAPPASLDARTTFRFCRCSLATADTPQLRDACQNLLPGVPGGGQDGNCTLLDIRNHDSLIESVPWRWTTQALVDESPSHSTCRTDADCPPFVPCTRGICGCTGWPCPRTPVALNPSMVDLYGPPTAMFEADRETEWRLYSSDVPRWIAEGVNEGERFPAERPGASIPGVLWTHTPGPAGQPDFDVLPGYGVEFRELASFYWSGPVAAPITVRAPFPCFAPLAPFLGSSAMCPVCESFVPAPWIAIPSSAGCGAPRLDMPFIQLGPDPLDPIPGLVPELDVFTNDPGPWIGAAETGRWLPPEGGVRYVKLVDGAIVGRTVFERDGAFTDLKGCPNCEPIPPPLLAESAIDDSSAPQAREGQAAVLSARRGALWLIGGRSVPGGGELRDLWRYDVEPGAWRSLPYPAGFTLGHVLAATYSPFDDRLWILDEVIEPAGHRGRSRSIRLTALSPEGGAGEEVARWPHLSDNEAFAMSVDPAGALWIAGWPTGGRVHAVVRLARSADGGVAVLGWDVGVGRVVEDHVRASDRGLSLVVEAHLRGGPSLVFNDVRELRTGPGGEHACF